MATVQLVQAMTKEKNIRSCSKSLHIESFLHHVVEPTAASMHAPR
jgi:hypothetical protein